MNKVEKKLDVLCLGAAVVDIPLRPVSREVFDIESYPVDNIAMAVGGDAMNESTIISRLGCKTGLMAAIGDDAAGAFILRSCDEDNIDTEGINEDSRKFIEVSKDVFKAIMTKYKIDISDAEYLLIYQILQSVIPR